MLYSQEINKICSLCRNAKNVTGSDTHLECISKNEYVPFDGTCDEFVYDIFKKPTRRKRRLSNSFNPEDFKL